MVGSDHSSSSVAAIAHPAILTLSSSLFTRCRIVSRDCCAFADLRRDCRREMTEMLRDDARIACRGGSQWCEPVCCAIGIDWQRQLEALGRVAGIATTLSVLNVERSVSAMENDVVATLGWQGQRFCNGWWRQPAMRESIATQRRCYLSLQTRTTRCWIANRDCATTAAQRWAAQQEQQQTLLRC